MPRALLAAAALLAATPMMASEVPPAMTQYIEADLKGWINGPEIVAAIQAQNSRTGGLSEDEIIARDQIWRAQVGAAEQPLIQEVLMAPLSESLRGRVTESGGRITEVFVMDSQGLNVASSGITSDYWQGDEAKFSRTYGEGPGAVFVDEIELDESTQRYQGQVSFSVSDPGTGQVIGAVTVGLDAAAFY